MAACLLLGVVAIRRGDVNRHRAWMVRGYALGLAAGTQVLTGGLAEGTGELRSDVAKGLGWVINLAVAEWVVRCPGRRPRRRQQAALIRRTPAGALA